METTPQTIESCYARAVEAFPLAKWIKVECLIENGIAAWWVGVRINGEMIGKYGATFDGAVERLLPEYTEIAAELARTCPICGGKNYDAFAHAHTVPETQAV